MGSILIQNGLIADGAGAALRRADLLTVDGRIAAVGPSLTGRADTVIDAAGRVAVPGFIDIHAHSDATIFDNPRLESKLFQGVTTEVTGNCGVSAFPAADGARAELEAYFAMHGGRMPAGGVAWRSLGEYAAKLGALDLTLNLAPLVGHGSLRLAVMGATGRAPTAAEMAGLRRLLDECLAQGAWGMSAGLIYPPGSFAAREELTEMAKVLAARGALFAVHIRDESGGLLAAVDEMVAVAKDSGVKMQISHLKALGRAHEGRGRDALARIAAARRRGVDMAADQYPYAASATALSVLAPPWAHDGGVGRLLERLRTPELAAGLRAAIAREMESRGGAGRIMLTNLGSARNAALSGRTLAEIAARRRCAPAEAVRRILLEEDAAVGAVYFAIDETDLTCILRSPFVAVGSDGRGLNAEQNAAQTTHPRSYGAFARVLGRFVREEKRLPLELAIYKMTGLPAARLGLKGRGLLREGCAADITVFDPARIEDRASYEQPHRYAAGVEYVIVGGAVVLAGGALTGARPGRVLLKRA